MFVSTPIAEPTAVHAVSDVQETAVSLVNREPGRFGARSIDHREPERRSISGR